MEAPPKLARRLLLRAGLASLLIVVLSGAAVASAVLLQLDGVVEVYEREGRAPITAPELSAGEVGGPKTIMILGSDERFDEKKVKGSRARSDTIILVRLDKDNDAVSVMSLPRDLKVNVPGFAVPTKINAAFEQGGARLTLRTVEKVLSRPGRPFEVNHIVSIGFEAFQRAINYVGCVYFDVDRRYFNDNSQGQNYAVIDIKPGYQKLCGQDSLDYVRHRYSDNDLFRAARQQEFLRQVRNQRGVRELADLSEFKKLVKVFARYFDSDRGLRKNRNLIALAKLAIFASEKPVREIPFVPDGEEQESAYLLASQKRIDETVDRFMAGEVAPESVPRERRSRRSTRRRSSSRASTRSLKDVPNLVSSGEDYQDQAVLSTSKLNFPFYYPGRKYAGTTLDGGLSSEPTTRTYTLRDERGRRHRAYRMTMRFSDPVPQYYGVQGTTWREPPLLDGAYAERTVNGRKLRLYYDGNKLRLVAWRTDKAVYWISNSLMRKLSNRQMLAIAGSFRRLGGR